MSKEFVNKAKKFDCFDISQAEGDYEAREEIAEIIRSTPEFAKVLSDYVIAHIKEAANIKKIKRKEMRHALSFKGTIDTSESYKHLLEGPKNGNGNGQHYHPRKNYSKKPHLAHRRKSFGRH